MRQLIFEEEAVGNTGTASKKMTKSGSPAIVISTLTLTERSIKREQTE
jgi:hypothetical protein